MKHAGELSVFTLSYLYLFCSMLTFRAVIGLRFVRGKIIILPNPRPTPAPSSAPSLLFPHVLPPPSPAPPTPTHPRSTVGPLPTAPQRREPPGLRRLSPLRSALPMLRLMDEKKPHASEGSSDDAGSCFCFAPGYAFLPRTG